MARPLIETRDLAVSFGTLRALKPTNLLVDVGESVAVVGPNGSGKSSLLRALCGIEPAARGQLLLHHQGPRQRCSRVEVAYVAQRSAARWDLPFAVGEVVATGRRRPWWRRPGPADRAAVDAALVAVGLTDVATRPVPQLSGGQAQRVMLARALVQQPDVMILDEPFVGLDPLTVAAVTALLSDVVAGGMTVICALHELDVARATFARTVGLSDGRVIADGDTVGALDEAGVEKIFARRGLS